MLAQFAPCEPRPAAGARAPDMRTAWRPLERQANYFSGALKSPLK
jgi:hypothetical protein